MVPLFAFGPGFTELFWRSGWPLALILVIALIVLNAYFLCNRRLFRLLEREDWPALVDYLEQRVIHRGRYSSRLVRLLINSYLVMSDSPAVLRLEHKAAIAKPALIAENALVFGTARILAGDPRGAAVFFQARLAGARPKDGQWLRWYCGFSRILAGDFGAAEAEMGAMARDSGDALVTALSAYFLSGTLLKYSADRDACRSLAETGRERAKKSLKSPAGWNRETAKVATEVHAAVIRKYIDEAGGWLFA